MTPTEPIFTSDLFTWFRGNGVTELSDLQVKRVPRKFFVRSSRTGVVKLFSINTESAGYEDGWDGEGWEYIDEDGVKVTIIND